MEFLKNRQEMANVCKINIVNYDDTKIEKHENNSKSKIEPENEKINFDSSSSKNQKVEKNNEKNVRKPTLEKENPSGKKNSNTDDLLDFLDRELNS